MTNQEGRRPIRVVVAGGGTAGWITATALVRQLGSLIDRHSGRSPKRSAPSASANPRCPQRVASTSFSRSTSSAFMRASRATIKLGISLRELGAQGRPLYPQFRRRCRCRPGPRTSSISGSKRDPGVKQTRSALIIWSMRRRAFTRWTSPAIRASTTPIISTPRSMRASCARSPRPTAAPARKARSPGSSATVKAAISPRCIMEDGTRIEGDLFIDCTGFRSVLLGQTLETPFEDWLHWLPNDSAWATQAEALSRPIPIPARSRMALAGNGAFRCSTAWAPASSSRAIISTPTRRHTEVHRDGLEGKPLRDPHLIRFTRRPPPQQLGRTIASASASRAASSSRWNRPPST